MQERDKLDLTRVAKEDFDLCPRTEQVKRRVTGIADFLPHLLSNPLQEIPREQLLGLVYATYLSPGSPYLTPLFQQLTKHIKDPANSFVDKLPAIMIGDSLLHQINEPPEMRSVTGYKFKQEKVQLMQILDKADECEEASFDAEEELEQAISRGAPEPVDDLPTVTDLAREVMRMNRLHKLLVETKLTRYWTDMGDDSKKRAVTLWADKKLDQLFLHPSAPDMLLDPQMQEQVGFCRYDMWWGSAAKMWFSPDADNTPQKNMQLLQYYFAHPDIPQKFSEHVLTSKEMFSPQDLFRQHVQPPVDVITGCTSLASWIFLQAPESIDPFLQSLRQPSLSEAEKIYVLQSVIGFASFFQTCFPEHPNAVLVRTSINKLARDFGQADLVQLPLAILADQEEGYIARDGIQAGKAYFPQLTGEGARKKRKILYTSQKGRIKPQESQPLRKQESHTLSSVVVGKLPVWGEVVATTRDAVPGILGHVAPYFSWTDSEVDAAMDRIAEPFVSPHLLHEKVTVVPKLLPQWHPLRELDATIIGLERDGQSYRVLIDARQASIRLPHLKPQLPPIVVLTGSYEEDNGFLVSGADTSFIGTPLQLALTEAARLTMQPAIADQPDLSKDDLQIVRATSKHWNAISKTSGYPSLHADTPAAADRGVVQYGKSKKPLLATVGIRSSDASGVLQKVSENRRGPGTSRLKRQGGLVSIEEMAMPAEASSEEVVPVVTRPEPGVENTGVVFPPKEEPPVVPDVVEITHPELKSVRITAPGTASTRTVHGRVQRTVDMSLAPDSNALADAELERLREEIVAAGERARQARNSRRELNKQRKQHGNGPSFGRRDCAAWETNYAEKSC